MAQKRSLDEELAFHDWTRDDLKQRFGVHRNTISRWSENMPNWLREYFRVMRLARQMLDGSKDQS